jgi:asparagine synthase (glutamine-hydrolysing)
MGIAGNLGDGQAICASLSVLNRGFAACAPSNVMIWSFDDLQMGYCADASHAVSDEPPATLLFRGSLQDPSAVCALLNLYEEASLSHASLLMRSWIRYQDHFPLYVDGDYIFAIYDARNRKLILGCSPNCKEGIYYWHQSRQFYFSSQLGGLLALPQFQIQLDDRQAAFWLMRRPEMSCQTLYKGIQILYAGHTLTFEHGKCSIQRYWEPEKIPVIRQADARVYAEGLLEKVGNSVRKSLNNTGAIGSFLSGGVDRSSLVALSAGSLLESDRRLTAFTAVPAYPYKACVARSFGDEREHAAELVSLHTNIDHVLVPNNSVGFIAAQDFFTNQTCLPNFNATNSTWIAGVLLDAKRKNIRILLCGELGNLTASYRGEYALSQLLSQSRLLEWLRLIMSNKKHEVPVRYSLRQSLGCGPVHTAIRTALKALRSTLYWKSSAAWQQDRSRPFYKYSAINEHLLQNCKVLKQEEFLEPPTVTSSRKFRASFISRGLASGFTCYLRRFLGIELYSPYLDRQLIEYCFSIPEEAFCHNGIPRYPMREAMKSRLPDRIRMEQRYGLQSADAYELFRASLPQIAEEFSHLWNCDLANQYMDLAGMSDLIKNFPEEDFTDTTTRRIYLNKLARGISFGRFVRRLEDGSLLEPLYRAVREAEVEKYRVIDCRSH